MSSVIVQRHCGGSSGGDGVMGCCGVRLYLEVCVCCGCCGWFVCPLET